MTWLRLFGLKPASVSKLYDELEETGSFGKPGDSRENVRKVMSGYVRILKKNGHGFNCDKNGKKVEDQNTHLVMLDPAHPQVAAWVKELDINVPEEAVVHSVTSRLEFGRGGGMMASPDNLLWQWFRKDEANIAALGKGFLKCHEEVKALAKRQPGLSIQTLLEGNFLANNIPGLPKGLLEILSQPGNKMLSPALNSLDNDKYDYIHRVGGSGSSSRIRFDITDKMKNLVDEYEVVVLPSQEETVDLSHEEEELVLSDHRLLLERISALREGVREKAEANVLICHQIQQLEAEHELIIKQIGGLQAELEPLLAELKRLEETFGRKLKEFLSTLSEPEKMLFHNMYVKKE
ncbi:MAG: hypothetical protein A2493_02785 [Candidatus Magasanikbacteria bacterium RIFOXYC12_FULL_33_11]|uniref:Uncharacterized protein n=1 Tax=Candidatus Magasanikbacteria bacterium RIFOXYC12_FULL_33_11 TaxID=1798701 RepID=A0A1F6NML6_9BACT|nr:MAG: hypothetical protein A2493_02785 [Candidatus Magasanikbacteria bacterium RIFOXYC12_FULL_33_11]